MRLALAGLVLTALPTAAPARDVDAKKFGWFTDYPAAQAEARRSGKPILLVFRCEP